MKSIVKKLLVISVFSLFSVLNSILFSQNTGGAIKLEYNYPADKEVILINNTKVKQTMDIMGQSMEVYVNSALGSTIRSAGKVDGNLKLEVRIDTIGQYVDSPQGGAGGAVKDVKGKTFNMIITPQGKEIDASEAEKIVYYIEGSGETNAYQSFIDFFPDLPVNEIKPGDTWNSTDSVSVATPAMSTKMVVSYENKFEGIEVFNGVECALISSTLSGKRSMATQSQGMDIFTSGPFTGTSTLLFGLREGYFLKHTVITKMTGNIDISGPENMTFPLIMDMTNVNEVKK